MFGIPGEVFWPTAAIGAIIAMTFGAVALYRFLPQPKSRGVDQPDREALEDLRVRLAELDQLRERMSELEERVDFAERVLAKQRDAARLDLPHD